MMIAKKQAVFSKLLVMVLAVTLLLAAVPGFVQNVSAASGSVSVASYSINEKGAQVAAATVTNGKLYEITLRGITVKDFEPDNGAISYYKIRFKSDGSFFGTKGKDTWDTPEDGIAFSETSVTFDLLYDGYGTKNCTFELQLLDNNKSSLGILPFTIHIPQAANDPELPSPGNPGTSAPIVSDPDPIIPIPEPPSSEPIVKGTGFVLKSVNYGEESIQAGASFSLNATLLSTNGTYGVENVSVEFQPSTEFSVEAGSSILYVGTVKPNQSVPVVVPLTASAIVEEGSYQVTLRVSGVNSNDGAPVSADMIISIPIVQPERFEVSNVQVPSYLTANMDDGMGFSTVNLVNKGKGIIYNVSVDIIGEGLTTDVGAQFIGNINAGAQGGADFNVLASVPGSISAQVLVTYENAKGEEKTLTHDFVVEVADGGSMGMIDPMPIEPPMPPMEEGGMPYWAWLAIGVGGLAAIVVTIVLLVKHSRKKKAAALEVDDEAE